MFQSLAEIFGKQVKPRTSLSKVANDHLSQLLDKVKRYFPTQNTTKLIDPKSICE